MNKRIILWYILLWISMFFVACAREESTDFSQWALDNYGQMICDVPGVAGIDISLPESESIELSKSDYIIGIVDTEIKQEGWVEELIVNPTGDKVQNNNEHGYNVLGIICSGMADSTYTSVLSNANYYYIPLLDDKVDAEYLIQELQNAEMQGVKVMNCSFVMHHFDEEVYEFIKNSDMLFVCAAGNNGENELLYPAAYDCDNIISVIGCDNQGYCSAKSNYSEEADIAAPGEDILCMTSELEQYVYSSGTSLSTAYVTAVCAYINCELECDAIETKRVLLESAKSVSTLENKVCEGRLLSVGNIIKVVDEIKK